MKRRAARLFAVAAVTVVAVVATGQPASAENLWEKLFGCEGAVPISCPGPVP